MGTQNETRPINQFKARVIMEAAKRGWTLTQFADAVGRSPQALNEMLNRNNPRLDTVKDMAGALGMSMEQFAWSVHPHEFGEHTIPRMEL